MLVGLKLGVLMLNSDNLHEFIVPNSLPAQGLGSQRGGKDLMKSTDQDFIC